MRKKKPVKLAPNYLDLTFVRNPDIHWELRADGNAVVDLEHRGFSCLPLVYLLFWLHHKPAAC